MFSRQALRKLIFPLVVEQFLSVMVGMADIMMVSSAGETAVSSVALVDLINSLILNIFAALATGGAVVASQAIGARHQERAAHVANQLTYIVLAIALVIMGLVLFLKAPLLRLLFGQVEPAVMEGSLVYFTISALSYPFIAVYSGGAALFRSMGNSRVTMYISLLMNGVNIAGNAVLVYGFGMGVAGVAWPSFVSRTLAAVIILCLLRDKRRTIYIRNLLSFRLDFPLMRSILRIGIPSSLENSVFQLGRVLLVSLISTFGTVQIAANAVANNLDYLGVIPGQAIGLAIITVVGQCVGAGEWEQVRRYTKRLLQLTYLCMWALNGGLLVCLPFVLNRYSLSAETWQCAFTLVLIHAVGAMVLWPASFTLPNALRATGDVRVPMVISIVSMLVFRVGFSLVFGVHMELGVIGVWIAMVVDWAVRVACFIPRVRKKLWLVHPSLEAGK